MVISYLFTYHPHPLLPSARYQSVIFSVIPTYLIPDHVILVRSLMNYLSLNFHLFRRENWSGWQKFVWVIQLFGSNFLIVLGIYSKLHKLIRPSPKSSLVGGQAALIYVCLSGRLQFRAPPLSFKISVSPSYLLKHSIDSSAYSSSFCQSSQYNTSPCF